MSLEDLAALEKELDCRFTVLRPAARVRKLGGPFRRLKGLCWSARVPDFSWCAEQDQDFVSPLRIREHGLALGPGGSPIDLISHQGRGKFRHWRGRLFFSTSNNSDPNANGRSYFAEAAPLPRGDNILELEHRGTGTLALSRTAKEKIHSLKPELVLLAEPPDRNIGRLARALNRTGVGSMVFFSGKRWQTLDLARPGIFRAGLTACIARRYIRGRAAGLRSRLGRIYQGLSGLLPERMLSLAFRLQSDPWSVSAKSKPSEPAPTPDTPDQTGPLWSLFLRDLETEQGEPLPGFADTPDRLEIIQYISQLGPGGAERQSCYLAGGLKKRGHGVRVLTSFPLQGSSAHYASLSQGLGVSCAQAGQGEVSGLIRAALENPLFKKHLLPFIPPELALLVRNLTGDLLRIKPRVLHCWLDWSNIIGGLAGYLAGTPLIVLSTRNLNPSRFPTFYRPWQRQWYSFLAQSRRVCLVANSQAGAEDYASWLGLPLKDFRVIRNGLAPEAVVRPTPEEAALFRKELGLSKDDLLVGGVFRLDPEKRPLDFLKVIKKIRDRDSRVKAVIAGQGTLSRWLGKEVRRMGLEDHVFLLGRREDVPGIMAACQVILLTSAYEGTPNVLIEAQWLGLPVVATRAGGSAETVADNRSGFIHEVGDVDSLAQSVRLLLDDAELREQFGRVGRRFVQETFDLQGSIQATLDLYRDFSRALKP